VLCLSCLPIKPTLHVCLSPSSSLPVSALFVVPRLLPKTRRINSQTRHDCYPHPRTLSPSSSSQSLSSRFSQPNSFAVFASDSDSDSDSDLDSALTSEDHAESLSSAADDVSSSLLPRQMLPLNPSSFASIELPPLLSPVYKVSYDLQGLPVTVPLPFSPSRSVPPVSTALASSVVLSALVPSSPLIADSGCTGFLLQLANLPCLLPFFSPHPLPIVPFNFPDGSSLSAGGPSHSTGFLTFPHKLDPAPCYFLPSSDLSHSLFGVSPLIRPSGHAIFTRSWLRCSLGGRDPIDITMFLTATANVVFSFVKGREGLELSTAIPLHGVLAFLPGLEHTDPAAHFNGIKLLLLLSSRYPTTPVAIATRGRGDN
jgi:hypothetical protein